MGAVVSVMVSLLLLVFALERSLRLVDEALDAIGGQVPIPCDLDGVQVPT